MIPTKDQEKEALKKITEIINDLGSDTYLSAAFDGCIELAEENISNDFMSSYKEIAENAHKAELAANAKSQELKELLDRKDTTIENLEKQIEIYEDKNTGLRKDLKAATTAYEDQQISNIEKDKEIQELQNQIITLKAKLYDLITK